MIFQFYEIHEVLAFQFERLVCQYTHICMPCTHPCRPYIQNWICIC